MKKITSFLVMSALGASVLLNVSCETHAGTGALIGGGTGALIGGAIGHQSGNTAAGAVIGGAVGAGAGAAIGSSEDDRERRRYYRD